MYVTEINGLKHQDDCKWNCDNCNQEKITKFVAAKKNFLKNSGKHYCRECFMKFSNPSKQENRNNNVLSKEEQEQKIEINCSICNESYNISKLAHRKNIELNGNYTCKSCAQRGKIIGEEQKYKISQSLKGRILTDEHKRNISMGVTDYQKETLVKNCYWQKGLPNPRTGIKTPKDVIEKIRKSNTGKIRTPEMKERYKKSRLKLMEEQGGLTKEAKEKISKVIAQRHIDGNYENVNYKSGIYEGAKKCINYKSPIYRSSYEEKALQILEEDERVISYSYEPMFMEYELDGIMKNYIPDFIVNYVDGIVKMIEIKPEKRMRSEEINRAKKSNGEEYCKNRGWVYEHWGEIELGLV